MIYLIWFWAIHRFFAQCLPTQFPEESHHPGKWYAAELQSEHFKRGQYIFGGRVSGEIGGLGGVLWLQHDPVSLQIVPAWRTIFSMIDRMKKPLFSVPPE
jgi:hypothetical protein